MTGGGAEADGEAPAQIEPSAGEGEGAEAPSAGDEEAPLTGHRPRRRSHNWERTGALLTGLSVVVGLLAWQLPDHGDDRSVTKGTQGPSPTPSRSSTLQDPAAGRTPPVGSCVSASFAGTACTSPDAMLVVSATGCTATQAVEALGRDPRVEQLDVRTSTGADQCLVRPGPAAAAAGATAQTLLAAQSGSVADALRLCRASATSADLACTEPHHWEWTSDWREDWSKASGDCAAAGRLYTRRVLDGVGESLQATYARAQGDRQTYRCAIATDVALVGSVREIGNSELPTAG